MLYYCAEQLSLDGHDCNNVCSKIKESKITRGYNFILVKEQSRLYVRKCLFSQRNINVWNKLSTDCVHASSVNMFKNRIDKYLTKAGYTWNGLDELTASLSAAILGVS